jgi:predicted acyl esterase
MSPNRNQLRSAFAGHRWGWLGVLVALWTVATGLSCQPAQPAGKKTTVQVAMRDGTKLATDLYLPEGEGPWPVVLMRTPYNKDKTSRPDLVAAGYAVVSQDVRGRFASEGVDVPFMPDGWSEHQDGYDTVAWILQQPWCNGKVGTWGGSALGITQLMMAGAAPPGLACQVIAVATPNLYAHAAYQGGAFRQALVEGWLTVSGFSRAAWEAFHQNPRYNEVWRQVDLSSRYGQVNVPAIHLGGWYDIFSQGTLDAFDGFHNHGGPGARGKQRLIMGPWTHGVLQRKAGDLEYPPNAASPGIVVNDRRWFDYWLKGEDNGVANDPVVTYYVMGAVGEEGAPGNEWRTADNWPVPATETPYYCHADGTLSPDPPTEAAASRTYTFDPANPVPTVGGANLLLPAGPKDQRPVENRPDVLVFTTPPLKEPLEVTGRIRAHLWVSSSAVDTDFTAKLTDVYPDGRSMLITDGIIRARYRHSVEREELLTPGEVVEVDIDLWSTSLILNRGHRLRLALSSSNAPRFQPNPNTGEAFPPEGKPGVPAENTVYFDAAHPSHVILPVVK